MNLDNIESYIGLGVIFYMGVQTGCNFYSHHNVNYEEYGQRVYQKADGITAYDYTSLVINEDGSVEIDRYSLRNYRFYTDKDGDGKVDRVFQGDNLFGRGSYSRVFRRDKHLEQYPEVFERADQDFRQQMKRFRLSFPSI